MRAVIIFLVALFSFCGHVCGQQVLFVIDSIPLLRDPEDWNPITNDDIADISVVRNKDSLKLLGWAQMDAIEYVFTKAYRNRPDSIKRIPSLKQMTIADGVWQLHGAPYSGRYIDYYNSGRIQNDGTLLDGKATGPVTVYFKNGAARSVSEYRNGLLHGTAKKFYKNGALMSVSAYTDGRPVGFGNDYFFNGQSQGELKPKNKTAYDTLIFYYSTGKVRSIKLRKYGVPVPAKNEEDINYYSAHFNQSSNTGNVKEMEKNFYHLWMLDSANVDRYFDQGILMTMQFRFDDAIAAFNTGLQKEPLLWYMLAHRALARLKKQQLQRGITSLKDKKQVPLALDDLLSMKTNDQNLVCQDLQMADEMDQSDAFVKKIFPASIMNYCMSKKLP